MPLPDEVLVYPTHGAGSLCGKGISSAPASTIGDEKRSNAALQPMPEAAFVQYLLADQPFVPLYFAYDVQLNKTGAPEFKTNVSSVPRLEPGSPLPSATLVIDTRPAADFKRGHVPGAINLQDGLKFETWLGSILKPEEPYYLVVDDGAAITRMIAKAAKIGYETAIQGVVVEPAGATETSAPTDLAAFKKNPDQFTVVDIRNPDEVKEHRIFPHSLTIPLPELRQRLPEIPTNKPILVHCAGGYRSAAGSSLIARKIKSQPVYDFGEAIQQYI
jgi:rhodanese-related sulfurtransferase